MFQGIRLIILTGLLSVFLLSCSKYQKLLKSSDYNLKYESAIKYYEKKDYYRATGLFEELENIFKGSEKAEKIHYYMSYCYYNQGDYMLSAYYFKNFCKRYPYSQFREECEYMSAYCSYLNSPEPSLDQSYTYKALEEMQFFINKYPASTRIPKCNEIIDKLRHKLETKSFNASRLYFNIGDYKAAIISFKDGLDEFPDTPYREEILFLTLKSSYLLAINSVQVKKSERFQNTVDDYYSLIAEFPQTKYLREAGKIFNESSQYLKN